MKQLFCMALLAVILGLAGCSLPPATPVTKQELYRTNLYTYFTVNESPETVLSTLNRDGEVVLEAMLKNRPVYVKILAHTTGLQLMVYDREVKQ